MELKTKYNIGEKVFYVKEDKEIVELYVTKYLLATDATQLIIQYGLTDKNKVQDLLIDEDDLVRTRAQASKLLRARRLETLEHYVDSFNGKKEYLTTDTNEDLINIQQLALTLHKHITITIDE